MITDPTDPPTFTADHLAALVDPLRQVGRDELADALAAVTRSEEVTSTDGRH